MAYYSSQYFLPHEEALALPNEKDQKAATDKAKKIGPPILKKIKIKNKIKTKVTPLYKKEKHQLRDNPESYIPFDEEGNIYISHVKIIQEEELLIAHGDLIVGDFSKREDYFHRQHPLAIPPLKLWEKGIIPYSLGNLSNDLKENLLQAIEIFEKKTPIQFKQKTSSDQNYIFFQEGRHNCYSRFGRTGGKQIISLSLGCDVQKISHEILHSLGFLHEQNREDRDQFLKILWQNINPEQHLQFKKIPHKLMSAEKTNFSFETIMLYRPSAFSIVENDYSIVTVDGDSYETTKENLAKIDIERVEILYREEFKKRVSP